MSHPRTVAYGMGALIIAGGVTYYHTKREMDARRRNHERGGSRPNENLSSQDRIGQRSDAEKERAPPSAVNAAIAATPAGGSYQK